MGHSQMSKEDFTGRRHLVLSVYEALNADLDEDTPMFTICNTHPFKGYGKNNVIKKLIRKAYAQEHKIKYIQNKNNSIFISTKIYYFYV